MVVSCSLTTLHLASHMFLALCLQDGERWAALQKNGGVCGEVGSRNKPLLSAEGWPVSCMIFKTARRNIKPARVPDRPALALVRWIRTTGASFMLVIVASRGIVHRRRHGLLP